MAYLKNASYLNMLKIEGGKISDYPSCQIKYYIRDNRLTDFSGRTLCIFDGERIKDFGGRILLTVTTDTVRNYGGQIIAKFDTTTIKDFGGIIKYRIDGFVSRSELMAIIALIYAV